MNNDEQKLVDAWIARYEVVDREGDQSPDAERLFWSFEELDRLASTVPAGALRVILAIANTTQNRFVLDNLAAGPLESLLARHGINVIDAIEEAAQRSQEFRELLRGVWPNAIDPEVWRRVEHACEDAR